MSLNARDFTLPGQWAKEANTTIPPIPISGQPYRNETISKATIENGQNYDNIADSADWNQLMYLASGMALESEQYGIPRWSPLTDYVGGASLCIGTDGIPYRAMLDSGPSGAGSQDPTTTTGYWMRLSKWIVDAEATDFWLLQRLTANLDVYVATTGSDTLGDGSAVNPWRTIQFAVNKIAENYFLGAYTIYVHVAAGTYNESIVLPNYLTNTGYIWIEGTSPGTTIIGVPNPGVSLDATIYLPFSCNYTLTNITIQNPVDTDDTVTDVAIYAIAGSLIIDGVTILLVAGTSNVVGIGIGSSGYVQIGQNGGSAVSISAGAEPIGTFISPTNGGLLQQVTDLSLNGTTVLGTVYVDALGVFIRNTTTLPTITGNVTGRRFTVARNGIIDSAGGGANYIPGTVDGVPSTGGQYT